MHCRKSSQRFSCAARAGVLGLAAFLGAGAGAGRAQTEPVAREVVAWAEPCLPLHAEPDSKSAPIRCLAPGRPLDLLESLDGWARVALADGQEGWVLFRLVRPALEGRTAGAALESRQIAKLEKALAAAAVERMEMRRGTSALRSEIYELRLANEALTASVAELEADVLAKESLAGNATARLNAAEARLAAAEAAAASAAQALEASQLEAAERIEALEAARALADTERATLDEEASGLRGELARQRAAYEQLAAEVPEPVELPDSMPGSRLEILEEALGSLEAERLGLIESNRELRREVERLRDANEWLAVAAVEQPASVTVAPAVRREYERALDPVGPGSPMEDAVAASSDATLPTPASASAPVEESAPEVVFGELLPEARDATAAVEAWARAWSEQRVDDYLYFYSNEFTPSDSSSREAWEALRRERITKPERIDVRVALADLRPLEDGRMEVVFLQSYESDRMTDVVLKTLELVREDSGWKIAAERVE